MGRQNPLWWISFQNQNAKHTGPNRKYSTWNADVASVSKTSWGTPGCRTAVNTKRCSGSFNFTCKFNVDIALETLLFLACVNFLKIDSTVSLSPTLLVGYQYSNFTIYPVFAGPQSDGPPRSLHPVES